MRTTETMVTFRHPFVLTALEATRPAGTYRLVTEEEEIPYGQNIEPAERITHLLDGTRPPTIWR